MDNTNNDSIDKEDTGGDNNIDEENTENGNTDKDSADKEDTDEDNIDKDNTDKDDGKIELSDLELLKETLIGKDIDTNKLGNEFIFDSIVIKTYENIFLEELYDGTQIAKIKITYNEKDYTITIKEDEKIVDVIRKESKINVNKKFNELDNDEQNKLISLCTNFKLEVTSTKSFNEAQVCSGGVPLSEINLGTIR